MTEQFFERSPNEAASCICFTGPYERLNLVQELGMDRRYAEVTLWSCPDCGQVWLRYHYENEAFTGSGRWYLGAVTEVQASQLTAENAKCALEGVDWYFFGGSYFQGRTGRSSGAITL